MTQGLSVRMKQKTERMLSSVTPTNADALPDAVTQAVRSFPGDCIVIDPVNLVIDPVNPGSSSRSDATSTCIRRWG